MNWSAALVALVPLGVVTVTSTVPVPAGAVAVIWVALLTVTSSRRWSRTATRGGAGEVGAGDRDRGSAAVGPDDGLTCVTAGAGGSTLAVPCALARDPPTSLIETVVVKLPVLAYVCVPVTTNPPPWAAATVPVEPRYRRPS